LAQSPAGEEGQGHRRHDECSEGRPLHDARVARLFAQLLSKGILGSSYTRSSIAPVLCCKIFLCSVPVIRSSTYIRF
jgi:hypothetical protein